MDFGALIAFGATGVKKAVDLISFLLARQWAAVVKQLAAYAGGIAITFICAHSDFANYLGIAGLNNWSLVIAGLLLASAGSVGADLIAAADNTQSAAAPRFSLHLFKKRAKTVEPETTAAAPVVAPQTTKPRTRKAAK